jgi:hypothetical protein
VGSDLAGRAFDVADQAQDGAPPRVGQGAEDGAVEHRLI